MKIKMISKSILVAILTSVMLFITSMANYSNAGTVGFISFNNAPRKYLTINDSKLADITVRIEDNNGISYAKLYKIIDAKGNKKEIKFSSANTSNATSHVYTMSHKNMLKGKEQTFYIEAKDKTGNILKSTFKIVVKSKQVTVKKKVYNKKKKKNVTKEVKETVKYYAVNDSPRVINWVVSGNNMTVGIKDGDGTKVAKIQDMNNNNKEIYTLKNLAKGEARVTLDMTKFKANNKTYKLKFITEDNKGHESRRIVFFQMDVIAMKSEITAKKETTTKKTETKKETTDKKTTSTKVTEGKNVSSFVKALDTISKQVQKDYKAKKYWKYTNGVNSENKLPFKYTFQAALKTNTLTTNCADYVMWALHDCGIFTANQKFYGNNSGGITYKKAAETKVKETLKKYATITKVGGKKTPKTLVKEGKLKKGDILTYKGHTNVYAGNGKWYDAGRQTNKNGKGSRTNYTFTTLGPVKLTYNNPVYYIIRLKNQT